MNLGPIQKVTSSSEKINGKSSVNGLRGAPQFLKNGCNMGPSPTSRVVIFRLSDDNLD
jgi:hypothetical protein